MCQVTIVPDVDVSTTCQLVVVLFSFVQFSPNIRYLNSISKNDQIDEN